MRKALQIGIVGCGLIGEKRALSIGSRGVLIACADLNFDRAEKFGSRFGCHAYPSADSIFNNPDIDVVIIATLHNSLSALTFQALSAGKHVFVEKPAARYAGELIPILKFLETSNLKVRVGFNHRYHRAIQKAKNLIDAGAIGDLMFMRGRYGHGGRVGYEKEWRSNFELSGGGELIDQGPHLIDLSRWFLGDFDSITGFATNYFWNMDVDDNAFMILKNIKNQISHLHVSCSEWKNLFSLEIYGKLGKLEIFGLGGSYGTEKLTLYEMLPEMGPPNTTSWEYPMADNSWSVELDQFYDDILLDRKPSPSIEDAYQTLRIIEKIYKNSKFENIKNISNLMRQ